MCKRGRQDVQKTSCPDGFHVAIYHALHGPLDILAGLEVHEPRLEQPLEGHCMHFSALVALHIQQRLVFHLIQNGLHGSRSLDAMSCQGLH